MNATQPIVDNFSLDMLSPDSLNSLVEKAISFASIYGLRLIVAIVVLLFGILVARQSSKIMSRILRKAKVDDILNSFMQNIVYYTVLAAFIVAALGQAGINITSFLAVLGAAGLAVGLALKDTLSNFAAGVVLILLRLFKKGDFVTIAGKSGTVQGLTAFYTELSTTDNQKVVVPNSSILNATIINTTAYATRRVDMVIGISYEDDIKRAKEILWKLIESDPRILKDPKPKIVVGELGDSSVNLYVRPWTSTEDCWSVRWDMLETIKVAFDKEGISIPYPQQDVHIIGEEPKAIEE
jgi:small conductance mechanosensitive channel